jgi:hypothetical protein
VRIGQKLIGGVIALYMKILLRVLTFGRSRMIAVSSGSLRLIRITMAMIVWSFAPSSSSELSSIRLCKFRRDYSEWGIDSLP